MSTTDGAIADLEWIYQLPKTVLQMKRLQQNFIYHFVEFKHNQ